VMTVNLATVLRLHAKFVAARCPDGSAVAGDMCDAADEIERLRAIVDKLPKTADGVTVVPGMLLYHYATGRPLGNVVTYTAGMRAHGQWAVAAYPVGDCYSTREAAEAAGGE